MPSRAWYKDPLLVNTRTMELGDGRGGLFNHLNIINGRVPDTVPVRSQAESIKVKRWRLELALSVALTAAKFGS